MAKIHGVDTKPEKVVRRVVHRLGGRFCLHDARLHGRPDLVLPRRRLAIFVHGCFWHRHDGCRRTTTPTTRREFWQDKFQRNVDRDAEVRLNLEAAGWRVHVVWECETFDEVKLAASLWAVLDQTVGTDLQK